MGKRTALFERHNAAGGKIVDFAGWEMPLHYGSQIDEHHLVRNASGIFDVSHMAVVDLRGVGVQDFLLKLLANDVSKLTEAGKALYSCMLNNDAGVIDDLIVYYMDQEWYRLVVNAGTREKDLVWISRQAMDFEVDIQERTDLAMVAVQGPDARQKAAVVLPAEVGSQVLSLKRFHAVDAEGYFVARTGYTGEDGFEVLLPVDSVGEFWDSLVEAGVAPVGLGARDTLRLEAGMNLYGSDMDESVTPLESGLMWTVARKDNREFIGRSALEMQIAAGANREFVGLILEQRGMLRNHMKVMTTGGEGEITSGGFSPTLGKAIALARVPTPVGSTAEIEIRGKYQQARVVKPPFVREGKSCVD